MKLQGGKQEMLKVETADSNGNKVNQQLSFKSNSKLRLSVPYGLMSIQ